MFYLPYMHMSYGNDNVNLKAILKGFSCTCVHQNKKNKKTFLCVFSCEEFVSDFLVLTLTLPFLRQT